MRLLAIDPGNEESAYVLYDVDRAAPVRTASPWAKLPNAALLDRLQQFTTWGVHHMAVEMIASYGMPVGAEVFETCVWVGRFIERWDRWRVTSERVFRREVKLHLCNSARAKDANVRQALIDRYGGRDKAIGRKATPGPLYGLVGDCWSALAVAITVAERSS